MLRPILIVPPQGFLPIPPPTPSPSGPCIATRAPSLKLIIESPSYLDPNLPSLLSHPPASSYIPHSLPSIPAPIPQTLHHTPALSTTLNCLALPCTSPPTIFLPMPPFNPSRRRRPFHNPILLCPPSPLLHPPFRPDSIHPPYIPPSTSPLVQAADLP